MAVRVAFIAGAAICSTGAAYLGYVWLFKN